MSIKRSTRDSGTDQRVVRLSLVLALLSAAVLPAVFGVALLVSAALRRPLLTRALAPADDARSNLLTLAWGGALMVIAAIQLAGAAAGFGSITSPAGLGIRTALALGLETRALALTTAGLRRSAPVER